MKYYLLLLLLAYVLSQAPNCRVLKDKPLEKLFLVPGELQAYTLRQYFEGYNLNFTTDGNKSVADLIEPFYQTDTQPLPQRGNDANTTVIDFSMETDGNLAWMKRASSLTYKTLDGTYVVQYGTLNEKFNVKFTDKINLAIKGATICFNVITVHDRKIVVDCQSADDNMDVMYVIDEVDQSVKGYPFSNTTITTKRKSIPLTVPGGRTFILSAFLQNGVNPSQQNKTFVAIYALDTDSAITPVAVIDATTLKVDDLSISDITVDAMGNIYVADIRGRLSSLYFDGANITVGQNWTFGDNIRKVSVHVTQDLVKIVQVVGNKQVYEVDLENEVLVVDYFLPENATEVISFQTNTDLLIVQTTNAYYIYRRYMNLPSQMLHSFSDSNSRFIVSPRTPYVVFLGASASISYVVSQGFLIVKNTDPGFENLTKVTVTATSVAIDGDISVNCSMEFQIKSVTDRSQVYVKGEPLINITSESPFFEIINLDDYFVGSKLSYAPQPSANVTMTLHHIEKIQISSDDSVKSADWFATYSYDLSSYYKVSVGGGVLTIQNCEYNGEGIECKITRKMDFDEKILYHTFFRTTTDLQPQIPILAYVTLSNRHNVNVIQINSDRSFNPVIVSEDFDITDIDANQRFIFVTVKDSKQIYVFKNDLKDYALANIIKADDFPNITFYPHKTALSPVDINILVVVTVDSILLMKVTAFDTELVSTISLPDLSSSKSSIDVTVGKYNMIVFMTIEGQPDQIIEYGIYDIYAPIEMRKLDLLGKVLTKPIEAYSVDDANMVAVRTQDLSLNNYLTIIRTGRAAVGSILTDAKIEGLLLSLVSIRDSAILEVSPRSESLQLQSSPELSLLTFRYYYRPLLLVRATAPNNDSFKQSVSYNLSVFGISNATQINRTIMFYNIKSKITAKNTTIPKIQFSKNSNAAEVEVVINADEYFSGPVARYNISCPYCDTQIRLKDHVTDLGSGDGITGVKDFYWFGQKGRLWSLNDSSILITDGSLHRKRTIPLNFTNNNMRVNKWTPYNTNFIVILATDIATQTQYFVPVGIDPNQTEEATVFKPVEIALNVGVKSAQQMKSCGNRIFILDNTLDGSGRGIVHVFTGKIGDDGNYVFAFEDKIDAGQFGLANNTINDFELVDLQNNSTFFIASVDTKGMVYGSFNTSANKFELTNPALIDLSTNDQISNFQINGSRYLQLQVYSSQVEDTLLQLSLLMTVSNGQHLQLGVKFTSQNASGYVFDYFFIESVFAKYGRESVINWAQGLPFQDHGENLFLVGHQGMQIGGKVSLGLYSLEQNLKHQTRQMIGAVERDIQAPLMNNIAAIVYRDGSNLRVALSLGSDSQGAVTFHNLSSTVSIVYKFDQPGNFDKITLEARNQYGNASRDISVEFDKDPINPKGMAWYIILAIVVGALLVVGLVVFFVMRYRKGKSNKLSLLSNSKAESDEEI